MSVVSFKRNQGQGWSLGALGAGSVQSLCRVLWTLWIGDVPLVGSGFFASLKQEVFFTSLPLAWRLYQESSWWFFWFLFPWSVFGSACFYFWPIWGASGTIPNLRAQRTWTNTRKDIKIHQLWLLWGGDPHQKFNRFPICSVLGC